MINSNEKQDAGTDDEKEEQKEQTIAVADRWKEARCLKTAVHRYRSRIPSDSEMHCKIFHVVPLFDRKGQMYVHSA